MTSNFAEVDIKTQQSVEGVDFSTSGQLVVANLDIDSVLVELTEISLWELSNYSAVEWWLTDYKSKADDTYLEKVRGYLEAFYHLSEVEDWERAKTIIMKKSGTLIDEELHIQLGTWGYFQEQVDLCSRLLGKLGVVTDSICLNTLGLAYDSLSNYPQAIKYYEQDLMIARELKDIRGEGVTLGNLGNAYFSLIFNSQALDYFEQALVIAQKIKDRKGEGNALGNLGNLYGAIANYTKAGEYHSLSLSIAPGGVTTRLKPIVSKD
jgi:tetratricopeptide (TPR) repeat protein